MARPPGHRRVIAWSEAQRRRSYSDAAGDRPRTARFCPSRERPDAAVEEISQLPAEMIVAVEMYRYSVQIFVSALDDRLIQMTVDSRRFLYFLRS